MDIQAFKEISVIFQHKLKALMCLKHLFSFLKKLIISVFWKFFGRENIDFLGFMSAYSSV